MITLEPKQAQLSYTFSRSKQSQTNNFSKKKKKVKKNDRIAGDKVRNSIGNLKGVARASPDNLHLIHIELSFAPLAR